MPKNSFWPSCSKRSRCKAASDGSSEAYSSTPQRAPERANAAGGPFSAAWLGLRCGAKGPCGRFAGRGGLYGNPGQRIPPSPAQIVPPPPHPALNAMLICDVAFRTRRAARPASSASSRRSPPSSSPRGTAALRVCEAHRRAGGISAPAGAGPSGGAEGGGSGSAWCDVCGPDDRHRAELPALGYFFRGARPLRVPALCQRPLVGSKSLNVIRAAEPKLLPEQIRVFGSTVSVRWFELHAACRPAGARCGVSFLAAVLLPLRSFHRQSSQRPERGTRLQGPQSRCGGELSGPRLAGRHSEPRTQGSFFARLRSLRFNCNAWLQVGSPAEAEGRRGAPAHRAG